MTCVFHTYLKKTHTNRYIFSLLALYWEDSTTYEFKQKGDLMPQMYVSWHMTWYLAFGNAFWHAF